MEILFFEEVFMYNDTRSHFMGVTGLATLFAIAFIIAAYTQRKQNKFLRNLYLFGGIFIFFLPFIIVSVFHTTTYVKCTYEVQLHDATIPEGYKIESERGEITTLVQKLKKSEYTENACELK